MFLATEQTEDIKLRATPSVTRLETTPLHPTLFTRTFPYKLIQQSFFLPQFIHHV